MHVRTARIPVTLFRRYYANTHILFIFHKLRTLVKTHHIYYLQPSVQATLGIFVEHTCTSFSQLSNTTNLHSSNTCIGRPQLRTNNPIYTCWNWNYTHQRHLARIYHILCAQNVQIWNDHFIDCCSIFSIITYLTVPCKTMQLGVQVFDT